MEVSSSLNADRICHLEVTAIDNMPSDWVSLVLFLNLSAGLGVLNPWKKGVSPSSFGLPFEWMETKGTLGIPL